MEHLTTEALARLVDEAPTPEERGHLNRCRRCRDELDALQAQTLGLSHLPDLRPPRGDWESLELRLRREGLIHADGDGAWGGGHRRIRRMNPWLQGAAAVLLLAVGAGAGAGGMALSTGGAPGEARGEPRTAGLDLPAVQAALGMDRAADRISVAEAEELVRVTESWYLSALVRYRERLGVEEGGDAPGAWGDPVTRYAALETLLAAGRAALREAPADPFLNGLLLNMQAEREATLRGIRAGSENSAEWF
jgi:hypothetical protein